MPDKADPRILDLIRGRTPPFMVPTDGVIGLYKIENEAELGQVIKVKHVDDVAALVRNLDSRDAWLLYTHPTRGRATIIAMTDAMYTALIAARRQV